MNYTELPRLGFHKRSGASTIKISDERLLDQAENLYRTLFKLMHQFIIMADKHGNPMPRDVAINTLRGMIWPAIAAVTGEDLPKGLTYQDGGVESKAGVTRYEFDSQADRDEFIDRRFSERKGDETPGFYSLPDGDSLGVFCNTVTHYEKGT